MIATNGWFSISEIVKTKLDDQATGALYGVITAPQIVFFRQGDPVLYESMYIENGVDIMLED